MWVVILIISIVCFILLSKWLLKLAENRNKKYDRIARDDRIRQAKEDAAAAEVNRLEKEHIEQQRRKPQEDMIQRFATGELTRQMLNAVCGSYPCGQLPEEIVIYDDRIFGKSNGEIRTFDFASNRVHNFNKVIWVGESCGYKYIVRPQIAMAEAINRLLNHQYVIYDQAKIELSKSEDDEGCLRFTDTYISDHVVMKLASTLPNRSF